MQRVVHEGRGETRWGLERACEVTIGKTATTPDWRAAPRGGVRGLTLLVLRATLAGRPVP